MSAAHITTASESSRSHDLATMYWGLSRLHGTACCLLVSNLRLYSSASAFSVRPIDGGYYRSAADRSSSSSETSRCTRKSSKFMMQSTAADQHQKDHQLVLLAQFPENDDGDAQDRLQSLASAIAAKHGDRVAVKEAAEDRPRQSSNAGLFIGVSLNREQERGARDADNCRAKLPAFQLLRGGLAIDEYHAYGDRFYEEEVHKRVDAALALAHEEDTSTLKNIWSPDAASGDYRDEMSVAAYAVQVASIVARELQEELCKKGAISKMDSSPVTVGDFSVQAIVLHILARYFPGYGFIAEEASAVLRQDPASLAAVLDVVQKALHPGFTEADLCAAIDLGGRGHGTLARERLGRGGRTWVLDPIDGTKGFLRGEQFCIALGLLESGKAVAGILGCPNLPTDRGTHNEGGGAMPGMNGNGVKITRGLLYSAAVGEGTFVRALSAGGDDTRRVMVDHARRPSETRVLESVEAGHTSHGVAAEICSDLGIELLPIRVDSQCKYGLLSEGQGGIYLRLPRWGYVENIWDHVAGAVVIREAGGKVTDSRGMPLDFSLGAKLPSNVVGVVATSGKIHAEVIRVVHHRQLEDWARVVAQAKSKGLEEGEIAPSLPGVNWACGFEDDGSDRLNDEWWASALENQPLVMRTSGMFYSAIERGWDKLVAVLFHGSWTQESQHAVGIFQHLASLQRQDGRLPPSLSAPVNSNDCSNDQDVNCQSSATDQVQSAAVVLAEADVMTLIDVADRQAIATLPSVHLYLGGREIVRFQVEHDESAESLGGRIEEVARRVHRVASTAGVQAAAAAAATR